MRGFRRVVSGAVCAAVVAATLTAFSPTAGAWTGTSLPSNTFICRLLAYVAQIVGRLPDSQFKTSLLAEITEEQAEHGCN